MNWKGFLKQNKNKILVTFLLAIIFAVIFFLNMVSNPSCYAYDARSNQFCIVNHAIDIVLVGLPLLIAENIGVGVLFSGNPSGQFIIVLFFEVLYLYLLSITIIYIHNKLKNKQK